MGGHGRSQGCLSIMRHIMGEVQPLTFRSSWLANMRGWTGHLVRYVVGSNSYLCVVFAQRRLGSCLIACGSADHAIDLDLWSGCARSSTLSYGLLHGSEARGLDVSCRWVHLRLVLCELRFVSAGSIATFRVSGYAFVSNLPTYWAFALPTFVAFRENGRH